MDTAPLDPGPRGPLMPLSRGYAARPAHPPPHPPRPVPGKRPVAGPGPLHANDLARKPAQRRAKPFTYRLVRTESTAAAPESG